MADGTLYRYNGNYSYFLEKREERITNFNAATEKAKNLLRTELDWIRRTPCARGTKARYRVNAFEDLKERASQHIKEQNIEIKAGMSRLGKKIINCKGLHYRWEDFIGVKDFSYNFAPGEKIGIIGKNGVGKSTFLNLLIGELQPTSGEIDRGTTLNIGYYKQSGIKFKEGQSVIEFVHEIADNITLADGKVISASSFLNYFLFPPSTHYSKIEKLSGGEKRRLYLLSILIANPNLLILDEPTNDLDILTLNVLEDYLKTFKGSVIIVSHDRFFLDKIVDHLFIFKGDGEIKDFPGSYSDYREYQKEAELTKHSQSKPQQGNTSSSNSKKEFVQKEGAAPVKRKLTYKEQKELEQLEKDLEQLSAEKKELEELLSSGNCTPEQLTKASTRIGEIITLTDEKEFRWLELSE
jgi:ATP-binding cassette subfamily F protein uup